MVPVAAVLVISQQGDGVSAVGGWVRGHSGQQGKATLPEEKGEEEGWWWCLWGLGWDGGTKELLWMEVYDVNPFLSSLHTNNKKPA